MHTSLSGLLGDSLPPTPGLYIYTRLLGYNLHSSELIHLF